MRLRVSNVRTAKSQAFNASRQFSSVLVCEICGSNSDFGLKKQRVLEPAEFRIARIVGEQRARAREHVAAGLVFKQKWA
jgi:hypothetical protein